MLPKEKMSGTHAKALLFLVIVLVTLLFFFHAPSGGFQSMNGPTTPLTNLPAAVIGLLVLLASGSMAASCFALAAPVLVLSSADLPPASALRSISLSLRC